MKKLNLLRLLLSVFAMAAVLSSCKKDESFSQVTVFERGIHEAINDHRVSVSKPEMVLQFLMIDDAQSASAKLANGTVTGIEPIVASLRALQTDLGGTASSVWTVQCQYENVDSVMSIVLGNAEIKATIEGNFNQSAVGAVKDKDGIFHITHFLMLIP